MLTIKVRRLRLLHRQRQSIVRVRVRTSDCFFGHVTVTGKFTFYSLTLRRIVRHWWWRWMTRVRTPLCVGACWRWWRELRRLRLRLLSSTTTIGRRRRRHESPILRNPLLLLLLLLLLVLVVVLPLRSIVRFFRSQTKDRRGRVTVTTTKDRGCRKMTQSQVQEQPDTRGEDADGKPPGGSSDRHSSDSDDSGRDRSRVLCYRSKSVRKKDVDQLLFVQE
jgi:hypothetical protein